MQKLKEIATDQFLYNEKWVPKANFRAFMWSNDPALGITKTLVKGYEEYQQKVASGIWFDSIEKLQEHLKHIDAAKSHREAFKESIGSAVVDEEKPILIPRRGRRKKQIDIIEN